MWVRNAPSKVQGHARGRNCRAAFSAHVGGGVCNVKISRPKPALSCMATTPDKTPSHGANEQDPLVAQSTDNQPAAAESGSPDIQQDVGAGPSPVVVVGAVLVVAAVALIALRSGLSYQDVEDVIASSGPLGPIIFTAAYVAATVLLFPASVLTLGAGYLFGPLKGTALVSLASTLGACVAFLISRYAARPFVEKRLEAYPRFKAVDSGVSREGAKIVLLLRLSPLFPFNLLNYGLGVTQVGFPAYAAASWAGMLPGTFAYVYLGSVGKAAVDAAGGAASGGSFDSIRIALYVIGGIATLGATKLIADAAGRALNEQEAQ